MINRQMDEPYISLSRNGEKILLVAPEDNEVDELNPGNVRTALFPTASLIIHQLRTNQLVLI